MASSRPLSTNDHSHRVAPPERFMAESSSTTEDDMDIDIDNNASGEEDLFAKLDEYVSRDAYCGVPMILPRMRFAGARNIDTIKDGKPSPRALSNSLTRIAVNFLGPDDEYVTSGLA
jgi:hypothetical protein